MLAKIKARCRNLVYFMMSFVVKLHRLFRTIEEQQLKKTVPEKLPAIQNYGFVPLLENEKLRVLFLFQFAGSWPSWKSVYEACLKDPAIDAQIVLVERMYPDTRLNILNDARNFLIENNIGFINDNAISLESFKPHIIFVQTPYHDTLPEKYRLADLKKRGIRIGYIPYGIEIGGGSTNLQYQFNLSVQQSAWRIFARSPRHKRMYAKYCTVGSGHVVTLGHPRMDLYTDNAENHLKQNLVNKISGRKIFLWNPHFTVEKGGWSTFLKFSDDILAFFEKHPEVFLLVRPHPLLFVSLRDRAGWSVEQVESFKEKISAMTNATLDLMPDYIPSLKAANVILTDTSSFLLEFFATGKPVLFLENAEGPGLNDDGDVVDYLYNAVNKDELFSHLEMMLKGEDPGKENRLKAIPEYFILSPKGIGESIKDYLLDTVRGGDKPLNNGFVMHREHVQAEEYWKGATTTYLAPESYYEKQEKELAVLLAKIGRINSAIDVGCGDGRFTQQICASAKFTKAIDVSSKFVEEAKTRLAEYNADVSVESITEARTCQVYDLVSCLGVTSGLIDNNTFLRTIDLLVASCKADGHILMKESLSTKTEQHTPMNINGYVAVYRNIDDYKQCFLSRGCVLVEDVVLSDIPEKNLVNKFFLFKVE